MNKLRRTMLFIPGDNPGMIQNADVFGADSVIIDLEDAVGATEKDSSRLLVRNALMNLDLGIVETVVRINGMDTEEGVEDINALLLAKPDGIMVPKATEKYIKIVHEIIKDTDIILFPIIEGAYSLETVTDIIRASDRIKGVLFGAEDFTADMGIKRTKEGSEIFYARNRIATVCKAFGVDAIDTPFTDTNDKKGLEKDTIVGKSLGMTGKAAINPRQIEIINGVYSPTKEEIDEAMKIINAAEIAAREGKGVISLDGKMIDAPIISRAEKVVEIAKQADLI
jgi:citrate lyase subunit beta/citryl-CoA lyase